MPAKDNNMRPRSGRRSGWRRLSLRPDWGDSGLTVNDLLELHERGAQARSSVIHLYAMNLKRGTSN